MRRTVSAILFLLTTAGSSSCSGPRPTETDDKTDLPSIVHFDFGQPIGMTRTDYADYLEQKALDIAETEMARLSAIELVYRNKMYYYGFEIPGINLSHGAYAKMYRQFTSYEVVDITSSDSLLQPILFVIEFNYDILLSEPVFVEQENREDALTAYINKNYHFHRGDKVRRTYSCDEKGSPQQPLPPPLERPNYWDKGTKQLGTFDMKEVKNISIPPATGRTDSSREQ